MKLKFLIAISIFSLILPISVRADLSVSLPWTMNFNNSSWVSDLALSECGGTSTHVASGCYSEGCMKVTPPTSACTGGGINGGQTGLGWLSYPGTPEVHIRFLIKFSSNYATNMANGGGGHGTKFLLQDSPSRTGILGLHSSDSDGRYMTWGVMNNVSTYVYRSAPNRGWIEDALFRVTSTQYINEWIAVEYWINTSTGLTGMYLWTQDEVFNGIYIDGVSAPSGINQTGFYMSYFNGYGIADANNYYLMDNVAVSNSYIGPPAGFVGGGDITPPGAPSGLSVM